MRVVKAFAREDLQRERFATSVSRVFDQSMISTRLRAFYNPFIGFLPQIGLAGLLFLGGRAVIDGRLDLGEFTAFYVVHARAARPDADRRHDPRAVAARDRVRRADLRAARPRAGDRRRAGRRARCPPGSGRVELRDATLAYEDGAEPALRDVTLTVDAGHDDRARRRDRLGQDDARRADLAPVRRRRPARCSSTASTCATSTRARCAARSPSSPTTRSSSARPCTRTSPTRAATRRTREEVVAAAKRAQAHDFIEALPDGYDTRVGERGLTLSGGQRQRIAIARALLADPRILILDDATSSVDASTEQQIKRALREVMAGRTTFVIAHRLSTIALADEIAVLEDGRLLDHGTHAELLERSAFYGEIVEKGLPDQVFLTRKALEPEVAGL